jgi:hypothetical protein
MKRRIMLTLDAIEYLERIPRSHRQKLRKRVVEIAEFPSFFADFRERDRVGRDIGVHICGAYAIKFWDDFNDRDLKIVEVCPSDRI